MDADARCCIGDMRHVRPSSQCADCADFGARLQAHQWKEGCSWVYICPTRNPDLFSFRHTSWFPGLGQSSQGTSDKPGLTCVDNGKVQGERPHSMLPSARAAGFHSDTSPPPTKASALQWLASHWAMRWMPVQLGVEKVPVPRSEPTIAV